MLKQARLYVLGDVIGVGFRAWTKIQAKIIGATGFARNIYDKPEIFGAMAGVEVIIQGKDNKINKMINKIKEGPPVAFVSEVKIFWEEALTKYQEFEIKK